jgi:DegV family protein with EDD domain
VPPVVVVADTTAYLPRDVVAEAGIELVSLYVNFGSERTAREVDLPDFAAFYDELRSAERLPTTSQPSVGDFLEVYERLLAEGRDIVSIHLSAGLSGTYAAALQAVETLEREGRGAERVHVVDSATAAGGLGLVVLAAAAAAAGGTAAEGVVRRAEEARSEMKMWFALDTLEYLKRGGRIGGLRAWVGSTLRVKPIVTVESEMTPVERVRTSARAMERLIGYARQRHASGADAWTVQHTQGAEQAAELARHCREIFGRPPTFISEIGPVLGVHTGPGLLGIGATPSRFLD